MEFFDCSSCIYQKWMDPLGVFVRFGDEFSRRWFCCYHRRSSSCYCSASSLPRGRLKRRKPSRSSVGWQWPTDSYHHIRVRIKSYPEYPKNIISVNFEAVQVFGEEKARWIRVGKGSLDKVWWSIKLLEFLWWIIKLCPWSKIFQNLLCILRIKILSPWQT